jgi:hypothetical protein
MLDKLSLDEAAQALAKKHAVAKTVSAPFVVQWIFDAICKVYETELRIKCYPEDQVRDFAMVKAHQLVGTQMS